MVTKRVIAISGTPGVGKSTLAESLSKKLGYLRIDLHDYYKEICSEYDRSKKCYNIDLVKFEKLVKDKLKENKGVILDTHISHLLSPKLVQKCVILTFNDLHSLEKRLLERKYSKKKVRENLDSEIFQICLMEAKEKGHKVIEIECSGKSRKKIVEEVLKKV
jgi:adenylate kinase